MADLEDFFAKRDKKKKKPGKFEAENVAKILEKKKVDMTKSSYQASAENPDAVSEYKAQDDDDEWREAVDDTPDFTGLKIQDLVEEESEDEEKEAAAAEAESQKEGPWKIQQKAQPSAQPQAEESAQKTAPTVLVPAAEVKETPKVEVPEPAKVQEPPTPVPAAASTGKFLPPHMRKRAEAEAAAAAASAAADIVTPAPVAVPTPSSAPPKPTIASDAGGKYVPLHLRQQGLTPTANRPKKAAPNIEDDKNFPSLGA